MDSYCCLSNNWSLEVINILLKIWWIKKFFYFLLKKTIRNYSIYYIKLVNLDAYPKVIHVYVILLLVVSKTTPLFSNEKKEEALPVSKIKKVYTILKGCIYYYSIFYHLRMRECILYHLIL